MDGDRRLRDRDFVRPALRHVRRPARRDAAGTSGASHISQTFTIPSGTTSLSFWFANVCAASTGGATATLLDHHTGKTRTVLKLTCRSTNAWREETVSVTAGHSYTLMLTNEDSSAGTYSLFDDVTLH